MPKVAKVVIEQKDDSQQHDYFISFDDYWVDGFPYPYRKTEIRSYRFLLNKQPFKANFIKRNNIIAQMKLIPTDNMKDKTLW